MTALRAQQRGSLANNRGARVSSNANRNAFPQNRIGGACVVVDHAAASNDDLGQGVELVPLVKAREAVASAPLVASPDNHPSNDDDDDAPVDVHSVDVLATRGLLSGLPA